MTGQTCVVRFEMANVAAVETPEQSNGKQQPKSMLERRKTLMKLPLFEKAGEELGAQITHDDEDFDPNAPPRLSNSTPEDPDEN